MKSTPVIEFYGYQDIDIGVKALLQFRIQRIKKVFQMIENIVLFITLIQVGYSFFSFSSEV